MIGGCKETDEPMVALSSDPKSRKLLFVVAAYGGASIIDSFLPVAHSEVGDDALAKTLNVFPDSLIESKPGRTLRSVGLIDNYSFYARPEQPTSTLLDAHGQDIAVMTMTGSTVNHTIGQERSITGAGINRGRTIMEASALVHGAGLPLPSCNMATEGFVRSGSDNSIPDWARAEVITNPLLFAAATHGSRAIEGAPSNAAIARARAVRSQLDEQSAFAGDYAESTARERYLTTRGGASLSLERSELIDKLLLVDPKGIPGELGLKGSALSESLRADLPNLATDSLEAQLATGFLLAYHGISAVVTLGVTPDPVFRPNGDVVGVPLAFDFSHSSHRLTQSIMWSRVSGAMNRLITLLKKHDYMGDPTLGKMWDRSLIYVATDFGREKTRPSGASEFPTGHDQDNGAVFASPLLKGDTVFGGVDKQTLRSHGFHRQTGEPLVNSRMDEGDVYSAIAQAMDVDFSGRRDMTALMKPI